MSWAVERTSWGIEKTSWANKKNLGQSIQCLGQTRKVLGLGPKRKVLAHEEKFRPRDLPFWPHVGRQNLLRTSLKARRRRSLRQWRGETVTRYGILRQRSKGKEEVRVCVTADPPGEEAFLKAAQLSADGRGKVDGKRRHWNSKFKAPGSKRARGEIQKNTRGEGGKKK